MCLMCENPELTAEDYLESVRERIARNRFMVQPVGGSARTPEFTYSVGLTAHGLPELIVLGLQEAKAAPLIHGWANYLLDESLVLPGETMGFGTRLLEAVEVSRPEDHLFFAVDLYGEAVRALQLVWNDDRGRWPWEPGHRARRAGQPVLGKRAPYYCHEHRLDQLAVPPHL